MSKRFIDPLFNLIWSLITIGAILLVANVGFAEDTYAVPQTTEVTLTWDANDPTPEGYRIFHRAEGEDYDYSQPSWTGSDTEGTVYNLDWDTTYYFVARAYDGDLESVDSEEVSCHTPVAETTTYAITATDGDNGSISPSGTVTVDEQSDRAFTITADSGYAIADVIVDGVSMGALESYTFESIDADHTITANFAINTYSITASAGANGSVSPSGTASIEHGGSATYTITPNSGYSIADVLVDSVSQGPVQSHTFSNITANHSLQATFAADTVTVSVTAGEGGAIEPSGAITVGKGESQAFSITADEGYEIEDLLVDGVSQGALESYTLENITADCTVQALFILENQAPIADAGPDQKVDEGQVVTLSGLNSTDADDGIAEFQWYQIQGEEVVLNVTDEGQASFTAPDVDESGISLVFELQVTDYAGETSMDTCIVNVTWVNEPPTADAGQAQTVNEGVIVTLDGSGSSDMDDGIAQYYWEQTQGPEVTLSGSESAVAYFTAPDTGSEGASLVFQLTVTDVAGLQDTATCMVAVTWVNTPPEADAGADQQVNVGDEVTLDGTQSTDADGDTGLSYRWRQSDGTPVALSDATASQPAFVAPEIEAETHTLTFELTVTDSQGLQDLDTCEVVVAAPTAEEEDTAAPVLVVSSPSGDTVTTSRLYIDMSGSASDDTGVEQVTWKSNRGGSGVADGTTQWTMDSILLRYGTNVITLTATDAAGNATSVTRTVVVQFKFLRWWW